MPRDDRRFMHPHEHELFRGGHCLHRLVEPAECVLGEGLFQAEDIRPQRACEVVLFHQEQELVVVNYRPRGGSQAILVTGGFLKVGIAGEPERLSEAHDCRARGVPFSGEFLRAKVRGLVKMVDDVSRYGLLRA